MNEAVVGDRRSHTFFKETGAQHGVTTQQIFSMTHASSKAQGATADPRSFLSPTLQWSTRARPGAIQNRSGRLNSHRQPARPKAAKTKKPSEVTHSQATKEISSSRVHVIRE